jgi:hypothetical protein
LFLTDVAAARGVGLINSRGNLVLNCRNKRYIRRPFGRPALLLARRSPLRGCSSLAPRQTPKWPADRIAYFCNQALVYRFIKTFTH